MVEGGPSMGGFDRLPPELRDAVAMWQQGEQEFTVESREWFTDGRSGEPVGTVVYTDHAAGRADSERLVLKFLTHDAPKRAESLRMAWFRAGKIGFDAHLAEPLAYSMWLDGGRMGVFLRVAGGGIEDVGQLTELSGTAGFPEVCQSIVNSVVGDWNRDAKWRRPGKPQTIGELLKGVIGRRFDKALEWARTAGVAVDGDEGAVKLGDMTMAFNPFSLLAGSNANRIVQDLRIGHAHGDLSGRNILLKVRNGIDPLSYVLIDYDRYKPDAPLARDPMHLLVALVLDRFHDFGPNSRAALARALVYPNERDSPAHLGLYRDLSEAVRAGSAPGSDSGWGDEWGRQCLLFLVGAGLVHLGRDLRLDNELEVKKWCFQLAALAAERLRGELARWPRRAERTATPVAVRRSAPEDSFGIRDRRIERQDLRNRLVAGGRGISVLSGIRGVGKTKLLDVVLQDLDSDGAPMRVVRHDANTVTGLDLGTLIDHLDGGVTAAGSRTGRSSLARLEDVLVRLGDSPVVVAVDSAENLLTSDEVVADPQLDRAFEMLATMERHAVTVLLVSQDKPNSRQHTWHTVAPSVQLGRLPKDDFFDHLAGMDHRGRLTADLLTRELRASLYDAVKGNPRHAELVHAVVVGDTGYDLPRLAALLGEQRTPDVSDQLMHLLLTGISEVRGAVLRALAAFDTPVPASAVAAVIGNYAHARVGNALSALVMDRIVYRVEDNFYLLSADSRSVMSTVSEPEQRLLYYTVAGALRDIVRPEPRSVADLRLRLAELWALLRAREYGAAYETIHEVDPYLVRWNCRRLVLEPRREVKGRTGGEHDELENLNALADILLSNHDFDEADQVLGEAMSLVVGKEDDVRAIKVHSTFASMCWRQGFTTMAQARYEWVRDQARRINSPEVLAVAQEGIAVCLRRKGRHEDAIVEGVRALAQYGRPDFSEFQDAKRDALLRYTIVALKVARWHGELGHGADAEVFVARAGAAVEAGSDDRLRSAYLDGLAVLSLDRGDVGRAEELAHEAADLAIRHHDEVTLIQARTTLAFCYLHRSARPDAWREIELAEFYRVPGRSLLVLALSGLAAHQQGDRATADERFERLRAEATNRVKKDAEDFAAHDFIGYAICGLHLGDGRDLREAVESFTRARENTRNAGVLIARMRFLLDELEAPARLSQVLDALDAS
ncbi:tetratricopeptide (TPR) repeat protein [Actinokineospora baliensis]|uniref:AAA family ATPase n=1 Tax=Actinokineospora baliensis TaxID=547056 RepID=UPI00195C4DDA|nr:AAA family ATPase [Actinokineospora baliensis]MBM7774709.1 tetratricopeptide (TPR) repeat protein [Actinokineospora baliensis]